MNTPRSKAGAPARTGSADLLEWAWGIIANAGGGNWELESPEWREAASRWRDAYPWNTIGSERLHNNHYEYQ